MSHDEKGTPLNLNCLRFTIAFKNTFDVISAARCSFPAFFRIKRNTFKPNIIKAVYDLGHEVGYHYESLSDTNGDIKKAIINFSDNLNKFRNIVPVTTCSMHGRPLKSFDNRDIWKIKENHDFLLNELKISGEVYLDIDYSDIAYINDTGRNWTSGKSNIRDRVNSKIITEFTLGAELLEYFKNKPNSKICFQIHPERWANNAIGWAISLSFDTIVNFIKMILKIIR